MKVAYSNYLRSHIKCVFKLSDKLWWFVLCDKDGMTVNGNKMRAQTAFSYFEWRVVK